jgi:hypothetical protein
MVVGHVNERLTDEQVQIVVDSRGIANDAWVYFLAREVQQWRALIPEVIEQLETFNRKLIDGTAVRVPDHMDFEAVIAKLRNAGGPT